MRKNKLFLMPLIAATLSLGSCSSDSPDMGGNETPNAPIGDKMYMKVRIGMPNDNGTRADNDGGLINGSPEEHNVYSLGFKFYNGDGSFYGYGESYPVNGDITTKPNGEGSTGNNIEAFADAVIAIQVQQGTPYPEYVVAYVNMSDWKQNVEPNMSDISLPTSSYGSTDEGEGMAMTSSNFIKTVNADSKATGYLTEVKDTDFKDDPLDAQKEGNPVEIYVERIAAKVNVTLPSTSPTNITITGSPYQIKFIMDGFALGGENTSSYQIKNLDETWTGESLFSNWNIADDRRCFWAQDINYNYAKPTTSAISYKKYNEGKNNLEPIYCHENTFEAPNTSVNAYEVQPFVYVMGHYRVTKEGEQVKENLYQYIGTLYPESEMINIMQSLVGTVVYTKDESKTPAEYIGQTLSGKVQIVSDGTVNGVKLQLIDNADLSNLYTKGIDDNFKQATPTDVNTALAAKTVNVTGFIYDENAGTEDNKGGHLVYYPVLIQHLAYDSNDQTNLVGEYGIVRNHIYEITINKIENLGIGVFNPNVVIVPDLSSKWKYLAAKIRILSWKVVNQKVDL